MNKIRLKILNETRISTDYYPVGEHRDLIKFCVCSEFLASAEEQEEEQSDFDELVCIVDKKWLFNYIKDTIKNYTPLQYLQEVYTSEDSIEWYQEAIRTGHLAMIDFH